MDESVLLCTSQIEASTSPPSAPRPSEFSKNFCSNSPSPGRKAVQMHHHGYISGDQMPPPRENYYITVLTFQQFLLCFSSCVYRHGLLNNTLTCQGARDGQVTGNQQRELITKLTNFDVEFNIININLL